MLALIKTKKHNLNNFYIIKTNFYDDELLKVHLRKK